MESVGLPASLTTTRVHCSESYSALYTIYNKCMRMLFALKGLYVCSCLSQELFLECLVVLSSVVKAHSMFNLLLLVSNLATIRFLALIFGKI